MDVILPGLDRARRSRCPRRRPKVSTTPLVEASAAALLHPLDGIVALVRKAFFSPDLGANTARAADWPS